MALIMTAKKKIKVKNKSKRRHNKNLLEDISAICLGMWSALSIADPEYCRMLEPADFGSFEDRVNRAKDEIRDFEKKYRSAGFPSVDFDNVAEFYRYVNDLEKGKAFSKEMRKFADKLQKRSHDLEVKIDKKVCNNNSRQGGNFDYLSVFVVCFYQISEVLKKRGRLWLSEKPPRKASSRLKANQRKNIEEIKLKQKGRQIKNSEKKPAET